MCQSQMRLLRDQANAHTNKIAHEKKIILFRVVLTSDILFFFGWQKLKVSEKTENKKLVLDPSNL